MPEPRLCMVFGQSVIGVQCFAEALPPPCLNAAPRLLEGTAGAACACPPEPETTMPRNHGRGAPDARKEALEV